MKDNQEVIKEFNELVNMTASDLEKWLKSDDSNSAGWPKETEDGETVGHDSGRKIVEILKGNPKKDPENYTEDQVTHMRKVVAYCKRHLAQETKGNNEKSSEEVKKTKSYASLKNWGHDFLKAQGKADGKESEGKEDEEAEAGDKRKTSAAQSGSTKKQQTQKGKATKKNKDEDEDEDENETKTRRKTKKDDEDEEMKEAEGDEEEEDDEEEGDEEEEEDDHEEEEEEEEDDQEDAENQTKRQTRSSKNSNRQATNGKAKQSTTKSKKTEKDDNDDEEEKSGSSKKGPKKGDTVSWSWGSGNPRGKVLDVQEEDTTITTKKGNKVTRKGTAEDPAVVLDAGSSKAIKSNHELN